MHIYLTQRDCEKLFPLSTQARKTTAFSFSMRYLVDGEFNYSLQVNVVI